MTKEKLMTKIEKMSDGCWKWLGSIKDNGYGQTGGLSHNTRYAHRISYELFKGKIPKDKCIDHLCRNKKCVNPEHLEAVTQHDNCLRAMNNFCRKKHSFDVNNTYYDKRGRRHCRMCRTLAQRRYRKTTNYQIWKVNRCLV